MTLRSLTTAALANGWSAESRLSFVPRAPAVRGEGLLPFKKGGFVLPLEAGIPIVPVAVIGTAGILARDGWQIDSGEIGVRVAQPMPTAGRGVEDRKSLAGEVRAMIEQLLRPD